MLKLLKQNLSNKKVLLTLLVLVGCAIGAYFYMILNNQEDTENFTTSNKEIVLFSMKGCSHCEKLQPYWDLFVKNYGNNQFVELKQVYFDDKPEIVKRYGVNGFPTILGLENGEKVKEFNSERTYENLVLFLNEMS